MQVQEHAQMYSYDEVKEQLVKQKKSYASCASHFHLTERQFEALVYWYHLQRDPNGQFQGVLDSIDKDGFIKDCHVLSTGKLREKYNLSYHRIFSC